LLNAIDKNMLSQIAGLEELPEGAYNIRKNGEGIERHITENIDILPKKDKQGIDVIIKPETKGETVYIPVIISKNMTDTVYNSFEVGENSDVTIVAGCGIHNSCGNKAQHDGIHEFFVRKGAKMKYIEKHYGEGEGTGMKILNPKTVIEVEEDATVELEMLQIRGVDNTVRDTEVHLHKNASLVVMERLLTDLDQTAESNTTINLLGEDASAQIISRSVAKDESKQVFHFKLCGYGKCRGHIQCDSIIMDQAQVSSIPEISAFASDAELIHEAAIGKIASEQMTKLMSLGLTNEEAEETILKGFLK